jgi:hypothetical protein
MGFSDIWRAIEIQLVQLLSVIPNLITAVVIFLAGWLLAKGLEKITLRILKSVGADRLAERFNEIDIISNSRFRIVPSKLFSKIVYFLVIFIFTVAAVEALGMESISLLLTNIINYLPKLLSAFFMLIIGIVIADAIKRLVLTTCQSLGLPAARLIANLVFYFLFLNVIMITLKQADLQTAFMETNISIVLAGVVIAFAIGYGLASRSLMASLLSAFYNRNRIKVGDVITIEGVTGKIVAMDSTTMTLLSDQARVVVPLSKLNSEKYELHVRQTPPPPNLTDQPPL